MLSSGTTLFREIVHRITNELTSLASFTTKIKVVAPTWYGLEDFSCLLSASSRCGPRRASTTNPGPHRPQLCLRISVQQLFLRLIQSLSFTLTLLTLLATLMSCVIKKKRTSLPPRQCSRVTGVMAMFSLAVPVVICGRVQVSLSMLMGRHWPTDFNRYG